MCLTVIPHGPPCVPDGRDGSAHSLKRQTLDQDPLSKVFSRWLWAVAAFHGLILPRAEGAAGTHPPARGWNMWPETSSTLSLIKLSVPGLSAFAHAVPQPGMPSFSLPPGLANTCSSAGHSLVGTSCRKPSFTWRYLTFQVLTRPCSEPHGWDMEGSERDNVCACVLSHFSCVRLVATLWTVALQASLSIRFSRQEYWNGLPCPPPAGGLPDPETKPASLNISCIAGRFFITSVTWEALRVNDTGLIMALLWVVIPCREVSSPLD